jgi:hypothetical protein
MGLFIIVLMVIGTVLLIRNMNKHLRRLPDSFPDPDAARREAEITRLDADLRLPDAVVPEPRADRAEPGASGNPAEAEVKGVNAADSGPSDQGRDGSV